MEGHQLHMRNILFMKYDVPPHIVIPANAHPSSANITLRVSKPPFVRCSRLEERRVRPLISRS
eukprot:1787930-Pyramimonas_sp.AAC.1